MFNLPMPYGLTQWINIKSPAHIIASCLLQMGNMQLDVIYVQLMRFATYVLGAFLGNQKLFGQEGSWHKKQQTETTNTK